MEPVLEANLVPIVDMTTSGVKQKRLGDKVFTWDGLNALAAGVRDFI